MGETGDLCLRGSIIRKSGIIFTKEWRKLKQKSGCLNHSNERIFQVNIQMQEQIKDSWMYKRVGDRFVDFFSFILNIPWKWNNLVSMRPNYFIFIGYLRTGWVRILWTPLDPPLQCTPNHLSRTEQYWPFIHPLFWLCESPLISYSVTVWFPLKRNSPQKADPVLKKLSLKFSLFSYPSINP